MNERIKCLCVMLCVSFLSTSVQAVDVYFTGELRQGACTLRETDINVNLDTVVDRYLYINTRTAGRDFSIKLEGCDISIADSVKVTLSGTESAALPGLFALDTGSVASGIAVGVETQAGVKLEVGQESSEFSLVDGNNVIALKAYVRGEPGAITGEAIGVGVFTSTATFELNYP